MALLDSPTITTSTHQHIAFVHVVTPREDMPKVFGPAISEVIAALKKQGVAPNGPVFAHHLEMSSKAFDFNVGLPVAKPLAADGRVQPGVMAPRPVARARYQGDYAKLHAAWQELNEWMKGNHHAPAGDLWEVYVKGPEASADPTQWVTELNRPLAL
jgi:effector-binding domain-containing protein